MNETIIVQVKVVCYGQTSSVTELRRKLLMRRTFPPQKTYSIRIAYTMFAYTHRRRLGPWFGGKTLKLGDRSKKGAFKPLF